MCCSQPLHPAQVGVLLVALHQGESTFVAFVPKKIPLQLYPGPCVDLLYGHLVRG